MKLDDISLEGKYLRLSEVVEDVALPKTADAQYPGSHCAFRTVAGILPLIKNSYGLLLGPAICLYNAKLTVNIRSLTSDPRPNNLLFLTYSQDDIIFGFHKKVREAILEVDRKYHPEVLFLVTTCLQEIVGEDFDASVEEIQRMVKARLLVIHTDNFTCEDAAPGIENVFLSLSELMEPQETVEGSINLLGFWTSKAKTTELARLLGSEGIKIKNAIPSYCSPEDLSRAPGVSLNIALDHFALKLAKKMKEMFGTEYIYCERPYHPDSIELWYQKIADALGIDLDLKVADLKRETEELISQAKGSFSGKSCALFGQPGRTLDMAFLLSELGIELKAIMLHRLLSDDYRDAQKLLAEGIDPLVFRGDNALQTEKLLSTLRPDICIGCRDYGVLARQGIEPCMLIPSHFKLGFEATNEILNLMRQEPAGFWALRYKEQLLNNGAV
jgi:nitrogenase molybdenum-cofactor synthesis protein NifE